MTEPLPISSNSVLPKVCIFCSQVVKRFNYLKQKLCSVETKDFEENIRQHVEALKDDELHAKLPSVKVHYHPICRVNYQNLALRSIRLKELAKDQLSESLIEQSDVTAWQNARKVHRRAFNALICYIDEVIVQKKRSKELDCVGPKTPSN